MPLPEKPSNVDGKIDRFRRVLQALSEVQNQSEEILASTQDIAAMEGAVLESLVAELIPAFTWLDLPPLKVKKLPKNFFTSFWRYMTKEERKYKVLGLEVSKENLHISVLALSDKGELIAFPEIELSSDSEAQAGTYYLTSESDLKRLPDLALDNACIWQNFDNSPFSFEQVHSTLLKAAEKAHLKIEAQKQKNAERLGRVECVLGKGLL